MLDKDRVWGCKWKVNPYNIIFIIGITQGIWYEHGVAIWLSEKWITVVNCWQMIQGHVFGYNSNK